MLSRIAEPNSTVELVVDVNGFAQMALFGEETASVGAQSSPAILHSGSGMFTNLNGFVAQPAKITPEWVRSLLSSARLHSVAVSGGVSVTVPGLLNVPAKRIMPPPVVRVSC